MAFSTLRHAELLAALSVATDLGMGQPVEFAMQSCVVALRLADKLKLSAGDVRDTYYQALLRYIGCNAETRLLASIFGDELALRENILHVDNATPEYLGLMMRFIRQANEGAPPVQILQAMVSGLAQAGQNAPEFFGGHCEVASRLATRLGLGEATARTLGQVYARWDGKGIPPLRGEAIAPAMLVVSLAQDAVAFYKLGGLEAAITMARKRKGGVYAPKHVEIFIQHAAEILSGLEPETTWETVLALEPAPRRFFTESEFSAACEAVADFTDIKSRYLLGHSPGVARLAQAAVRQSGLPESDGVALRHAALLHDVGRVGVSAGIWEKAGPLTEREWEKVRLHPYYTERILSRSATLAQLGTIASLHHERLDGSGYHRGATNLPLTARLLAAADVFHALTETRPHRPAHTAEQAAEKLKLEARTGRLDREAVECVLSAAGQRPTGARREYAAGLSEREVEVLRLVARGYSIKVIAQQLSVAPKTVDNHIQHIYAKTGVQTRAGATLFAMENGLLADNG